MKCTEEKLNFTVNVYAVLLQPFSTFTALQPCVDLTEMRVRMPVVPRPVFNLANVHLLVQSDDGDGL